MRGLTFVKPTMKLLDLYTVYNTIAHIVPFALCITLGVTFGVHPALYVTSLIIRLCILLQLKASVTNQSKISRPPAGVPDL